MSYEVQYNAVNDRWQRLGERILKAARSELYVHFPFLDRAVGALQLLPDLKTQWIACDGERLFYDGAYLSMQYEKDRRLVCRAYFHMILHCMLRHVFQTKGRDAALWDLACDIAVESLLDALQASCVCPEALMRPMRGVWYARMGGVERVLTAQSVYRALRQERLSEYELAALAREFFADDHALWYQNEHSQQSTQQEQRWKQIAEQTETGMQTVYTEQAQGGQVLLEHLRIENVKPADYRAFLRRFAAIGEECKLDSDAFDYAYYTYGLQIYERVPLIEPLETREVQKIRDFVIAIDTSMSTSGEQVRAFLRYTCAMLKNADSFFSQIHLYILQCDDCIRSECSITSLKQLEEYLHDFELIGKSATDFRPVFARVEQLCMQKKLRRLKGLLYFTDGLGIYPERRPPYAAAFVMLAGQGVPQRVPGWGIRVVLEEQEMMRGVEYEY